MKKPQFFIDNWLLRCHITLLDTFVDSFTDRRTQGNTDRKYSIFPGLIPQYFHRPAYISYYIILLKLNLM